MHKKTLTAEVAGQSGKIIAKLTTDSVDRDGEGLIPQGMNSKDFEKNPVLFYNHEYDQPLGVVKNMKRKENAVTGELEFAQRPDGYQGDFFPSFIETLVKQGVVKGVSVGFVPEQGGARHATKADRSKFGGKIKRVFNKWKLLEVSIAPLPANQDALIEAVGKGLVTQVQCKKFLGCEVDQPQYKLTIKRKHHIKLRPKRGEETIDEIASRIVAKKMGRIYR